MEVSGKRSGLEVCGICKLSADGFCNDCELMMCNNCFQGHLLSRPCKHHVLGPISDGNTRQPPQACSTQTCKKHVNEYIKYYCRKHDAVTCGDCNVTDHAGCRIEFINAIAKNFQDNSEFQEYFRNVESLEEENTGYGKRLQSSISEGFTWATKALNDIKELRKKLNDALDRAEKELIKELDGLSKEARTITSDLKARESKVESDINDLKCDLDTNKYNGNDLFIRFVQSKPVLLKIEQSIAEIRSLIDIKSFTFEPNQQLNELIGPCMKLGKMKSLHDTEEKSFKAEKAPSKMNDSKQPGYDGQNKETRKERQNNEPRGSQKAGSQASSIQYRPPDPRASGLDVGKKVKYVGPIHDWIHSWFDPRALPRKKGFINIHDADGERREIRYGDNGTITNVEENGVVHVSWSKTGQTYRHNAGRNGQFDVALI